MNIKEQVISLKKELEALRQDTLSKEEIQKQIKIIKKKNKALLHSLIVMIVAFFILLGYTLYARVWHLFSQIL